MGERIKPTISNDQPVDPLLSLSDIELIQVFTAKPISPKVASLLESEFAESGTRDAESLTVLRDEAFGHFWRRQADAGSKSAENQYKELLSWICFSSARGFLGEMAMTDKLTSNQCTELIQLLGPDEWASRQFEGRLILKKIQAVSARKKGRSRLAWDDCAHICQRILKLKLLWVAIETIGFLENEALLKLQDSVEQKHAFSRRDRHLFREQCLKALRNSRDTTPKY